MVDLSLSEYAARHGIGTQRARALASGGRINARKVGSQWVVSDGARPRSVRNPGRPPSVTTVWAAAVALEEGNLDKALDSQVRRAAKRVLQRIASSEPGESRLRELVSLAANRGHLHRVRSADPVELAADPRVACSGLAWSPSQIQSVDDIDLYVRESDWGELSLDHALVEVPQSRANTRVRVIADNVELSRDVPALVAAADLADIGSSRAQLAASAILDSIDFEEPLHYRLPVRRRR